MRVDGSVSLLSPEGGPSSETPSVEWTGSDGTQNCFYWYRGTICAKNPSAPAIAKLYEIAQLLNARVQGDDGEYYGRDGSVLP
jgi:hypothetical protein